MLVNPKKDWRVIFLLLAPSQIGNFRLKILAGMIKELYLIPFRRYVSKKNPWFVFYVLIASINAWWRIDHITEFLETRKEDF